MLKFIYKEKILQKFKFNSKATKYQMTIVQQI